jgi:glycosyltransferase involved in cell wall biosynthesis
MKKAILFFHQSSELYGSDKILLSLVLYISMESNYYPIVVIPNKGPLYNILVQNKIKVIVTPVLKLSRKMFSFSTILLSPYKAIKSFVILRKNLKNETVSLVYSNTLALLLGLFYSKVKGINHVWHVHEIINNPKILKKIYPFLLEHFSDLIIYNSKASKDNICNDNETLNAKSHVVYNGLIRETVTRNFKENDKLRKDLNIPNDHVIIGLVGRISRWKGHSLMVKCLKEILEKTPKVSLVILGSPPPNQDIYLADLEEQIESLNLELNCKILPFENNIWKYYDLFDIVVVPSTEPEPFGLVALEAMLSSKPVVASAHGGLPEIIVHNETGFLFKPNDLNDFEKYILKLVNDKNLREIMGSRALERANSHFSLETHAKSIITLLSKIESKC